MGVMRSSKSRRKDPSSKTGIMAVSGIVLLCLSGCVSPNMDVLSTVKVDRTGTMGFVRQSRSTTDSVSDETAVRDAVTSADLTNTEGQRLPWTNAATGSVGIIDAIVENTNSGVVCRQFRTTRHAYDGVFKYHGRACLVDNGRWQLLSFRPAS